MDSRSVLENPFFPLLDSPDYVDEDVVPWIVFFPCLLLGCLRLPTARAAE